MKMTIFRLRYSLFDKISHSLDRVTKFGVTRFEIKDRVTNFSFPWLSEESLSPFDRVANLEWQILKSRYSDKISHSLDRLTKLLSPLLWQIPLKMLHTRNLSNRETGTSHYQFNFKQDLNVKEYSAEMSFVHFTRLLVLFWKSSWRFEFWRKVRRIERLFLRANLILRPATREWEIFLWKWIKT